MISLKFIASRHRPSLGQRWLLLTCYQLRVIIPYMLHDDGDDDDHDHDDDDGDDHDHDDDDDDDDDDNEDDVSDDNDDNVEKVGWNLCSFSAKSTF